MKRRSSLLERPTRPSVIGYRYLSGDHNGTSSSDADAPEVSPPSSSLGSDDDDNQNDRLNYALLIALYTLQGIPMGLSASIPFLIQQKMKQMSVLRGFDTTFSGSAASHAAKLSYKANAVFALCSWPFSLKLLWAPVVDACFFPGFGRRKSWLIPTQSLAGLLMVLGANFVERQLTFSSDLSEAFHVKGITLYFFALYFLMATQDIAVDGWALTMLSKKNRGRGPVCNSIGQNIGYFLSFVGFLALNDIESSEAIWRPLLGLKSDPERGLVSLGGFLRAMGFYSLVLTALVAIFKRESNTTPINSHDQLPPSTKVLLQSDRLKKYGDDGELDASEIGLKETYHRLWEVCKLPAVRWLFLILLTYRLPVAIGDNIKFLKAVEYGLSKSAIALLSPTVILPLGIIVPIVANRIWHGHPLRQFMLGYKARVTLVPLLDMIMLFVLKQGTSRSLGGILLFWSSVISSTAMQATASSLQFNAQMTFFASRVDPAIGGSYMTLLNTAANLGGTWPASFVMWLIGVLTKHPTCSKDLTTGEQTCTGGQDPYFVLNGIFALLGVLWIALLGKRVQHLAILPDEAWRTYFLDNDEESLLATDVEVADRVRWEPKDDKRK